MADLDALARNIKKSGPARVMVEEDYAVSYQRALADYQVVPTVVFIRDDDWSLGAPDGMIEFARLIWEREWVAVLDVATGIIKSYSAWLALWVETER